MAEIVPGASPASPAPAATPAPATPAPANTDPAATPSALSPSSAADPTQVAPADWPADWRDKLAGTGADDKVKQRLSRFATPGDIFKSYTELEKKLSSGQFKSVLPADAKPEDVSRWRQENGIPEKADGYIEKLDQGLLKTDADKKMAAPFLEAMLSKNASPEVVNAGLQAWTQIRDGILAEQGENDRTYQAEVEDTLRPEWGTDYRRNINVINGWLDTAGTEVKNAVLNARLPDGRPLASDTGVLRFLLNGALNANPAASVAPGAPGQAMNTIDGEIAKFETMMREKRSEWDRDPKNQERYLELLRAREALKGSRAA